MPQLRVSSPRSPRKDSAIFRHSIATMRKEISCNRFGQCRIFTTYRESIGSIAHLHSETINVWSHLFGTLWFCASATRFAVTATSLFSLSAAAILVYFIANIFCFACSTLYHVFADHAEADSWLRLDYLGIICTIWASSISFIALSFGCRPGEQFVYTVLVTATAALCSVRLSSSSQHSCSERRSRISTYVALGSLAALPAVRCWYLGLDFGLLKDFGMLVTINTLGGAIYATHLLDKVIGAKLGIPNASHNIMHVLAVTGALVYEQGLLSTYQDPLSRGLAFCA
jgi:adiponectin receptor